MNHVCKISTSSVRLATCYLSNRDVVRELSADSPEMAAVEGGNSACHPAVCPNCWFPEFLRK